MRQPATRELYRRWNELRGTRTAPDRNLLDPALLQGVIGETFILDVKTSGEFPVLIAGARCEALFINSLRGRNFVDLWPDHERSQISALCASVMDGCVPIVAGVSAAPKNHPAVPLEMLLLPLRHNGRTHSRILGCLQVASHPSWLGLMPVEALNLTSLRIHSVESAQNLGRNVMSPLRRTGEKASVSPAHAPQKAAKLTLLKGGRDN